MLNQPSTWSSAFGTFHPAATGLALFAGLLLGCPGPEPTASGAGGTGAVGNGGQGGDDKGSSSSSSTGPNLGGEGGGMTTSGGGMNSGGMNSGGEGGCDGMARPVDCGDCGVVCAFPNETTVGTECVAGVCQPTCAEHQFNFVADLPDDPMSWGCETRGRRVFVTKQKFSGIMFGGVAGADQQCLGIAMNNGLGGVWKAWLSDDMNSPKDDFESSPDPYYLLNGVKVAENFDHLITVGPGNELSSEINLDEDGDLLANVDSPVWTGTTPLGVLELDCGNWGISAIAGTLGTTGNANRKDAGWTKAGPQLCVNQAHLYCFEQ